MKIIHVVGPVGSGKSTFIKKYLSKWPCFDIKDIYKEYNVSPKELQDPQKYNQFMGALDYVLNDLFEKKSKIDLFVVESSGINQGINKILTGYSVLLLWIKSHYEKTVYQERPYAESLNKVIKKAIENGKIRPDLFFDWDAMIFSKDIPEGFKQFL